MTSPRHGDVLVAINEHKLYLIKEDPYPYALRLLKTLPRPLTMYFLPRGSTLPDSIKYGLIKHGHVDAPEHEQKLAEDYRDEDDSSVDEEAT